MTKGELATAVLLFILAASAFAQDKPDPKPLPDVPLAVMLGPNELQQSTQPGLWTGYIGLSHGKKTGYTPVGSLNYRLTDHYGLFVARSSIAYSGGVSFSFGHKK